jgi:hypothetical protein
MEFRREEIEKLKNIAETGRENGKFISKQVREDASSQVKRFNQQQNLLDKVTGLTEEQRMDRDSRKSANDARQEALNKLKEKLESLGIKADDNYQVNKEQKEINKENLKLEKKSIREKVRDRLARARDAVKEAPKALVTGAGKAVAKTASGLFDLLKKLFGPALIFGIILSIMKFLQSEENREKIKEIFEKIKAGFKFVIEKILIPLGPVIKAILEFSVATIVAGFEGIKKVMGFIQDFAENGPKPEEYKGLPVLGLGVTTTLGAISKSAKNADSTIGKIAKAFNTAFFGTAVPGPGGAGATKGGVVNYIRSFFRPLKGIADGLKGVGALVTKLPLLGLVSNFFVGSAKAVGGVAKAASPFLKLLGKLFLPLTIIIGVFDTIKGAISGFKEDDEASLGEKILNAIQGGLTGLVNSIIGIPLDLVVSLINFVAKKFGFEDGLIPEDMKPSKLIKKLIALPFDALKAAIDFVKGIFTDPVGTIKSLFYGLFGEEGILNFLVEPLEPVFNFIKKIFSFDFMGFIKKIPGVGKLIDFFTKDEAEKLAEIEEDIAKAEAKIAEARDRMERSEGGENVYYGDEEYKRAQDAKYIAKLEEEIAKAKAKELEITTGSKEPIIVNQDNSTNDNSTNSSSTSVTGKSTTPLAYSDAYYVIP